MNHILVAIDFSEVTTEVISKAISLHKAIGGRLRVLHVDDSAPYFYSPEDASQPGFETITVSSPPGKSSLALIRNQLSKEQIETEYRILEGPTVENILSEAKAFEADIIVIGAYHHGTFYHLLFGDTTESLIRHAPCPIFVVPQKDKQ